LQAGSLSPVGVSSTHELKLRSRVKIGPSAK
jgi:hypothetical protein